MGQFAKLTRHSIEGFEQLHEVVVGIRRDIVQIESRSTSADFWKRAVLEAMIGHVVNGVASERDGPLPSALKLVRKVDESLGAQASGAIHISRICRQLNVSRRTLHRAFHDTLGIGPIAFLRYRRLCAVHTALGSGGSGGETIANLAMQHGFLNVGRFANYYRRLFGEYPSDTRLQRARILR